jgi:hypothetical protein
MSEYVTIEEANKYQEFFNFMRNEHNLTLTITEMQDVIREVNKLNEKLNEKG